MKTKLLFLSALVCSMTFATSAFADTEAGFYEKEHIRGFISIGADYRGMFSEFKNYVNQTAFYNGGHYIEVESADASSDEDETTAELEYGKLNYSKFDDYYMGLHVNVGAQYKQFLTWFDINFMPSQVSESKGSSYTVGGEQFPLYDVRWFAYGADWMFGWKLFGEDSFINLIPAVGFGFNLMNFHLASNFDIAEGVTLRDRYYSTMATTVAAELELRVELGQFAIGAYGGYRYARYNELDVEGEKLVNTTKLSNGGEHGSYNTDNVGDTWYVGLRLTWIFHSDWQNKQQNKL